MPGGGIGGVGSASTGGVGFADGVGRRCSVVASAGAAGVVAGGGCGRADTTCTGGTGFIDGGCCLEVVPSNTGGTGFGFGAALTGGSVLVAGLALAFGSAKGSGGFGTPVPERAPEAVPP